MYLSQLRVRQHRVILRFDAKGMSVPSAAGVFLQACSFNPIDFKRRKGDLKALRPEKAFPVVTGYDGAGVIEAVGDGVSHLKIGDEVYTRVVHDTQGTAAEYCLSYGTVTALKPRSFSFEEAAAVPLAAMTALQMLRKAKFARGHKVPLLHPPVADCKPLAHSMTGAAGDRLVCTGFCCGWSWRRRPLCDPDCQGDGRRARGHHRERSKDRAGEVARRRHRRRTPLPRYRRGARAAVPL